jgi:hypothetical protein
VLSGQTQAERDARYRVQFFEAVRVASLITTKKQLETGIWKVRCAFALGWGWHVLGVMSDVNVVR